MGEAQARALGPRTLTISLNRDQISKKFRNALIVDDEIEYAHSVRQNLEFVGFEAQVVGSLDAAANKLFEQSYSVIICDNIFVDRSKRKGSEFIRDNRNLFGNGDIILMSGFPKKQIVDADLLEIRGVRIIKKEPGAIDQLSSICNDLAESKAEKYTRKLSQLCNELVNNVDDESELDAAFSDTYLVQKAKNYLLKHMKKFPNPDLAQFMIKGQGYSPNALTVEIERGTDVSRELIDQLLDDVLE